MSDPSIDHGDQRTDGEISRRDLLDRVLGAGAVVWAAGVCVPAAVYLWPARSRGPGQDFVEVGSTGDFAVGSARMAQKSGKPILVVRVKEDDFRAFSAVCTHLACVVKWDPQSRQIRCPCHAGFFGSDGQVISGPPPRPLAAYRVVVIGDRVRVYT